MHLPAESLILVLWTFGSIISLRHIKFFKATPLDHAPERRSALGFVMFGGIILFYISLNVIASSVATQLFPAPAAAIAATTTAPATTTAATATASASAPAMATDFFVIQRSVIVQIITGLITTAFVIYAAKKTTLGGLRAFGFDSNHVLAGLLIGIFAAFVLAPWMLMLQNLVIHLSERLRGGPLPVHPILQILKQNACPLSAKIWLTISAVIVAPIVEETVFRGVLQTVLLQKAPGGRQDAKWRWTCILLASLIFLLVHIQSDKNSINWEHFAPLFLLSCTLGYLYERTGKLWTNITLHAIFNGIVTAQTLMMIDGS